MTWWAWAAVVGVLGLLPMGRAAAGPVRADDFAVNLYGAVNRLPRELPRAQKPLLGRELVGLALRLLGTRVTAR